MRVLLLLTVFIVFLVVPFVNTLRNDEETQLRNLQYRIEVQQDFVDQKEQQLIELKKQVENMKKELDKVDRQLHELPAQ